MRHIFNKNKENKYDIQVGDTVTKIMSYIDCNYIRTFTFSELLLSIVSVSFYKEITDEKFFISATNEMLGSDSQVIMERIFYKFKKNEIDHFFPLMDNLIGNKEDIYELLLLVFKRYVRCKHSYHYKSERLTKEEANFINDLILMDMPVNFTCLGDIIPFVDTTYLLNYTYIDHDTMFKYLEEFFINFNYSISSMDYFKQILNIYYEYRNLLGESPNTYYTEENLKYTFLGRIESLSPKDAVEELEYRLVTYTPDIHNQKLEFSQLDLYLHLIGYLWEVYLYKLGERFKPVIASKTLTSVEPRLYKDSLITKDVNTIDTRSNDTDLEETNDKDIPQKIRTIIGYLKDNNINSFTYSELLASIVNTSIEKGLADENLFINSIRKNLDDSSKVIMERIFHKCTMTESNNLSPIINTIIQSKDDVYELNDYIFRMFDRTRTLHHFDSDELPIEDSNFIDNLILVDMLVRFDDEGLIVRNTSNSYLIRVNDDGLIVRYRSNNYMVKDSHVDLTNSAKELERFMVKINKCTTTSDDFLKDVFILCHEYLNCKHELEDYDFISNEFKKTNLGRCRFLSIDEFIDMMLFNESFYPNKNPVRQKFKNSKSYFRFIGYLWEVYLYKLGDSFRPNVYTRKGIDIDRCSKSKRYNTPSVTDEENKTTKITITTPENSITINTKQELVDLLNKFVDFLKNEKEN